MYQIRKLLHFRVVVVDLELNSGKQDHYDEVGEQEIKDEDDFLGDITDGFYISDWMDYIYEQDHKKK